MRVDFETLGDIQKKYERVEAGRAVMPGIPVLVRLDGVGSITSRKAWRGRLTAV